MSSNLWTWEHAQSNPVIIEDNVWIGRDAVIMKGVTVGQGSIVALRAVVVDDVPPYSIVAGNPAKVVKRLNPNEGDQL
nr:DapH/DapD/GlmU-related protein [Faecalicatena contorta]